MISILYHIITKTAIPFVSELRFLFGGEGEIFAQASLACTLATKDFAFPRPMELGRQNPSCCDSKNLPSSASGSGRFFSLSHREVFLACSNLSLRQRKKGAIGTLCVGGEGEIRTLEPLLTVTRFPIVRARPATRLLRICSAYNFQFYQRLKYNIINSRGCQAFFEKYFLFY